MRTCYFMRITSLILALVFGIGLSSCGDRSIKKNYGAPTDMTIDASFQINYLNVHYSTLRVCMKCHESAVEPHFPSFSSVKENIGEISETITDDEMPPEGAGFDLLNSCQKLILSTWISAGLPKTGGPTLGAPGNACY